MTGKFSMATEADQGRRHFLEMAAISIAASPFILTRAAEAQTRQPGLPPTAAATPGPKSSLGPLKQIKAGALDVGYVDTGPGDGPVVILLHGWPYDIHAFAEVVPLLSSAGYRVIVPHLRGYGTTRFLSAGTVRNGQQAVVAVDIVALMDALGVERAVLAGFDWGARTANVIAALWPERCRAMVSVSGYLIGSQAANRAPLPPAAELQWWYQFYFATERGRLGYEANRNDFAKLIWKIASPRWDLRRCHVRAIRRGIRESRPCRHRHSQLSLAPWTRGWESPSMMRLKPASPPRRRLRCRRSRSRATPMARPIPIPQPIEASSRGDTSIG